MTFDYFSKNRVTYILTKLKTILDSKAVPNDIKNGKLTIQKNGTNVQTFTANQSTNATANITVPTKTSELTNDSGYITNAGVTGVKGDSETTYRNGNVNITKSNIGLGNVGNFKAVSTAASQGLTDTEKSNARANIGAGTSSFSGSYNDLTNKPTIPTVNNGTLTIQKNGTNVQTFTANQSGNATANITVPTKVSELNNDSGYTTNVGTITGIKMNGASKGTSGVVDLGTVITAHQDISGKANTADLGDGAYKNSGVYYGTCATAAATKDKVATVSADQNFTLKVGAVVHVKFTYSNTYSATADNKITLNVNSTGAKNIYYAAGYPTGTNTVVFGAANYIMSYMYNGTDWVWVGFDGENNTTYNFSGTTFYSGNQNNSEHNANNAVKNGHYYYTSNGPDTSLGASTGDGALYVQSYSDSWVGQIAQDYRNGALFVRGKNNGTWKNWQKVYDTAHKPTASDVGLGNVGNFKAVSTVASQGLTDTEKSNARDNIGAGTSNFSGSYNDLSDQPPIPDQKVNDGTTDYLAYYSSGNKISSSPAIRCRKFNSSAATPAEINSLDINGVTCGNTASTLISNKAGFLTYGDGGPQITFNSAAISGQVGSLLFTDNDSVATGVSFNFLSNQGDWNVISKRFHARTSISIGTERPDLNYNLAVNGTGQFTNTLNLYREGTTANNYPAQLKFKLKDTTTGQTYDNAYIAAYQDHQSTTYGTNMVIHSGGGMFLGSGESPASHYAAKGAAYAGEDTFITADGTLHLQSNGNSIANRVGFVVNTSGYLIPEKADTVTNGIGGLGNSSYRVKDIYSQSFNNLITGSGTTAQDKGSGVSPRYFPAKWTFNIGRAPVDGDIITIKIPCAGHDYGVFVSINNGTNYHPVRKDYGTGRLTTHFGSGQYITLIYTPNATCNSIYAVAGADARSNITGCWTVLNWYDSNNVWGYCGTAAATAAKYVDMTNYKLTPNSYINIVLVNTNTAASALTLNINGQGAKPIYINGTASSASNYTLPNGTYLVYYNGTNYYFRTDGKITGAGIVDIGGNTGKFLRGDGTWQTVITSHQDISGKADKSATVSTVAWDSTNKKITKTINGNTSDVVTAATILGNLTKAQVTTALGYTPPEEDTKVQQTTDSTTNSTFPLLGGASLSTDSADYVKKFYNIRVNPSLSSLSVGGGSAIASGQMSLAHGLSTMVIEGDEIISRDTTASGNGSYAGGSGCIASGPTSHAEGHNTTASGDNSHAEGDTTTAIGTASHAEGYKAKASLNYSHAEGQNTTANGTASHAEGYYTTASGTNSHAEGARATASSTNSHAEGDNTTASGPNAHAEGDNTTASGASSHAEGVMTTASGTASHAEGRYTLAAGWASHAGGIDVAAYGDCSFIHGNGPSSSNQLKTLGYTFLFGNCQNNKFNLTDLNNCDGFVFSGSFQNYEYDSDTELNSSDTRNGDAFSGCICNTATITMYIKKGAMYVLFCSSYTISSGAVYGSIASLITAHALDTGTPSKVDMGKTSNAPATITMAANNKITIKNAFATRVSQFHLMRVI